MNMSNRTIEQSIDEQTRKALLKLMRELAGKS